MQRQGVDRRDVYDGGFAFCCSSGDRPAQLRPKQLQRGCSQQRILKVQAFLDLDQDREQGRRYRREVFDAQRWKQHRSVMRYYSHIAGMFSSRIVRGLLKPMLYVAAISCLVCCYHTLLDANILQQLAPSWQWPYVVLSSSGIFSISTFALSLLLVFRTNSSYERWWEARSCWTKVVSECKHLACKCTHCLPSNSLRAALLRWLRAFPISLKCHLRRPSVKLQEQIAGVLQPQEAALVLTSHNPPSTVLCAIGQLIAASDMRIESKVHMDESVRALQEAAETCDQIVTTPLPLSYTRHTGRFLVLWLTFLPFVTWLELGWFSVPVSMTISFLLFGIEEIGLQIEEPFGILALENFCEDVDAAIDQAVADASSMQQQIQQMTHQARSAQSQHAQRAHAQLSFGAATA